MAIFLNTSFLKSLMTIFLLSNVTNVDSSYRLSGLHFNYAVFSAPPFSKLTIGPNGTVSLSGASYEVLKWVATKLNYTYSLIPVSPTLIAELGPTEGAVYMLQNYENISGIAGGLYITAERKEKVDFAYFTMSDNYCLVVPAPGKESRIFAFVRPFQPTVWLLIFLSIFVVLGTMTCFTWLYKRNSLQSVFKMNGGGSYLRITMFDSVTANLMYIINILTNQGCQERFSRHSFRILTGFWVLVGMVLVNSYSGIVISSLTVPRMKPAINSLEELAASDDVKILLGKGLVPGSFILQAESGVYKTLGDKARNGSDQILSELDQLMVKLATGKYAFPYLQAFCLSFIGNQYKKDKKCHFKMTKITTISSGYYFYLLKKGFPHKQAFIVGLTEMFEYGFVRFWLKNAVKTADICLETKNKRAAKQLAIKLPDLISAFLILGIGSGVSILSFLLEIIYHKTRHLLTS